MKKFRCQKCGHRIAVPPRMMDRVVRCPECGGATHPLAEQLVGGIPPLAVEAEQVATKGVAAHQVRHCDNCRRLIGRLEESHVWQGSVVCVGCQQHLAPLAKPGAGGQPTQAGGVRIVEKPREKLTTAAPQRVEARRAVSADVVLANGSTSPLAQILATRPARVLLALMCVALAIYFVYAFLQVIGLLANVLVVAALLGVALYFLFRTGSPAATTARPTNEATDLPSRRT